RGEGNLVARRTRLRQVAVRREERDLERVVTVADTGPVGGGDTSRERRSDHGLLDDWDQFSHSIRVRHSIVRGQRVRIAAAVRPGAARFFQVPPAGETGGERRARQGRLGYPGAAVVEGGALSRSEHLLPDTHAVDPSIQVVRAVRAGAQRE